MTESFDIVYTRHGLASRMGDTIYINRILQNNKKLFDLILDHEMKHLNGQKNVDWNEPFNSELLWFILRHPSTWIHFSPIWIKGRRIILFKTMLYLWTIIIVWIMLMLAMIKWNLN